MRRQKNKKSHWFHIYLVFYLIPLFFHFKEEILHNSLVIEKNVKCTDSYAYLGLYIYTYIQCIESR